jgi:hypothetical protein
VTELIDRRRWFGALVMMAGLFRRQRIAAAELRPGFLAGDGDDGSPRYARDAGRTRVLDLNTPVMGGGCSREEEISGSGLVRLTAGSTAASAAVVHSDEPAGLHGEVMMLL